MPDVGQLSPQIVTLSDHRVAMEHCVIVPLADGADYCIVDLATPGGTFVNRQCVETCLLESGDLVQIGPYAFVVSKADGFLVPVTGIAGMSLELRDVGLYRLEDFSLNIPGGQFVAVLGQSGAGKSTLIRAITSLSGPVCGQVLCNGRDVHRKEAESDFRCCLGYVSQAEVIRTGLTAKQAVMFSAKLRRGDQLADDDAVSKAAEDILRQVDLEQGCWNRRVAKLSGGEKKRVGVAAELIANPRLLILDEPAAGLDVDREIAMLRLLRTLRNRGCTVIVVTHNLGTLSFFDRVVNLHQGRVTFDGTPADYFQSKPSDPAQIRPVDRPKWTSSNGNSGDEQGAKQLFGGSDKVGASRQLACLVHREFIIACKCDNVVKSIVVPMLFAISVGLAVKPHDRHILGFLAILASIWLSASLGVTAIVDERNAYEHERLLFLRDWTFLAAKIVSLGLVSTLQMVVFVGVLLGVRICFYGYNTDDPTMLYGVTDRWFLTWLVLIALGLAAVGLGLLISAAKSNKSAATFWLALVMMFQMVFSVEIGAHNRADDSVDDVYTEFDGKKSDGQENSQSPGKFASMASRLTLTRYADQALRTFAYHERIESAPPFILATSTGMLFLCGGIFLAATWGCLAVQGVWSREERRFGVISCEFW